ncbi:MAG: 2-oxoacid:acceptor oxidoreductase family protein [Alphaproteobacteria bacterium]|jgi:indolepyruvate ferredoxin oxidoreductase beta subunit|nr:2-oxoacid:acceptor oxidoreductase family protein [Alphaproteobacteria bacterium]
MSDRPTNVLIVGVGGQGVILVSKVLTEVCQARGLAVKQSEVHGMAKRGGAVFSHVRFGREIWSPTIAQGEADVLLALEWAEGLRWLGHLSRAGTLIADTRRIVPLAACLDRSWGAQPAYPRRSPEDLLAGIANGFAIDATGIAMDLGNARVANTVVLGALSAVLGQPAEDWQPVLARNVPPKTVEVNHAAFARGRAWIESRPEPRPAASPPARQPVGATAPMNGVRLVITESWCKGCDICVKMCPERCLALNGAQVVELSDAGACTGCRVCEWLCPDFAITVDRGGQEPRA